MHRTARSFACPVFAAAFPITTQAQEQTLIGVSDQIGLGAPQ